MKEGAMKKRLLSVFLMILITITIVLILKQKEANVLYSWSMDALEDPELITIIKKHHIKELYQDFSTEYLKKQDSTFLKTMSKNNVNVYHLCGDPSWGLDKDATSMKQEIDKVVTYNKKNNDSLSGIVFDIEPYLHNKENFNFALYVEAMKEAYKYATSKNIYMVIAIPVWFDTINKELLESLIKDGCDEISIMNYSIKYTKENIIDEVKYAQKYKKNINTIYEIESKEQDYFKSYSEMDQDFKQIQKYYKDKTIKKAYHYYEKMKQHD